MKEKIAKWYRQGLWTAQMVQDAVNKGVLTTDEAAEILSADIKAKETTSSTYPNKEV